MNQAALFTLPTLCQQRVADLLSSGTRQILAIVAQPGAGKSTLAQALLAHYGDAVQVVPMDGFHLANSELDRLGRRGRKGAPDTFDAAGFVSLLQRIKQQQPGDDLVYAPEFHRELEEAVAGAIAVQAGTPLIIVEGNYLLMDDAPWRQVRHVVNESWFLDVPDALRQARLLARHMRYGRSYSDAQDWIANTDEPNAVRIAHTRVNASLCMPWY
jgi:pantothenate kinase